ncbi:hypothetical protein HGRIS_004155 [Hohenbuehelia grisea]|uniref:Uncharacterized protein n=1 Tax=Hohenbuehelia grisea TaxID=104357 RepID=A0ABR3JHN0_9AGAR
MGASQSFIPTEAAVTTVAVAGAIAFGYFQLKENNSSDSPVSGTSSGKAGQGSTSSAGSSSKKTKKGPKDTASASSSHANIAPASPPTPQVVPFPEVLPGQFETEKKPTPAPKAKKTKKKSKAAVANAKPAASSAPAPTHTAPPAVSSDSESEASEIELEVRQPTVRPSAIVTAPPAQAPLSRPHTHSTTSIDTDGSWTRVESKRRRRDAPQGEGQAGDTDGGPSSTLEVTTSDAGATTPVTGTSSPIAERAEDDDEEQGFLASIARAPETRRPLAERLLPKPRKTGVDEYVTSVLVPALNVVADVRCFSMVETPDYPQVARVMRVQPRGDEKPASGFSWGDYEDVAVGGNGTGTDADGEDDGWGVVRRSGRSKTDRTPSSSAHAVQKAPETLTKKQRQNANKREAQKQAKAEADAERLATLAKHKREVERARMNEQATQRNAKTGRA